MIRAAVSYAERLRVAVHPVSREKQPLSPHGFKDATTSTRQVQAWWRRYPDANIGALCDWFFVVDVDPRNGGDATLMRWFAEFGAFPLTWTALTGSGGTHYYFLHDAALDAVPLGKLGDTGIDIKGGGRGYVLLPPSVSKSGSYCWLARPRETDIVAPPSWLVKLIVATKQPPARLPSKPIYYSGNDRVERAVRYARKLDAAVSGSGGHDATFRACCVIARGFALSADEAFGALLEWNQRGDPPWSESDLRRKISQALAHGSEPVGHLLERRAS
jgi:hypothetical protein